MSTAAQQKLFADTDWNYGFGLYQNVNDSNLMQSYYNQLYADQQKVWDREDSAIQRQVADMKKAGLNPWTAVGGSGAPTSNSNPTETALNGLITMLSLNNKSSMLKSKDQKWIVNTVIDFLMDGLKVGAKLF